MVALPRSTSCFESSAPRPGISSLKCSTTAPDLSLTSETIDRCHDSKLVLGSLRDSSPEIGTSITSVFSLPVDGLPEGSLQGVSRKDVSSPGTCGQFRQRIFVPRKSFTLNSSNLIADL